MNAYTLLTNCRICKSTDVINVIELGEQYITSRFPDPGENVPKTPITLCMCQVCYLLQLRECTNQSEMYEQNYGYRSGLNNTMRNHLKEYQEQILSKVKMSKGDAVLDIGSNDATMLHYYSDDFLRIGMDPTGSQFQEYYGTVNLIPEYFKYHSFIKHYNVKCKIISSISMFYDLPDPVQFAKDVHMALADDGIWTCEQSYLLSMIESNSIDTICHEHLEYYSIYNIKMIAELSDFKIIDIYFNNCNGGSFRIYFAKKSSDYKEYNLSDLLGKEMKYGINSKNIYSTFMKNCQTEITKLLSFLELSKNTFIYGASTKGNCLLQYSCITPKEIKYAVERNPRKYGKTTSTGIPIISEDSMRQNPPEYLLVLPWHFRNEIIEREAEYLNNGGQLIFPFPQFEIYSNKPKVMVTGENGMIASYFKKLNYTFYKFDFRYLQIIHPDFVIHLAGISNSQYALEHCMETIKTNGLLAVEICDFIHRNGLKTKFFNASSSELFKGHINYTITDNDTNFKHLHPYSIGKILSHNIVDFYREQYNLPFSNGIIFTTESPLKKQTFLLNKVANHIKTWKRDFVPLRLGNLESFRNIIHASDVANAIKTIISQNHGDNYVICGTESTKVLDLVLKLYSFAGIVPEKKNNCYYSESKLLFFIDTKQGNENSPTNIDGKSEKLNLLGWKPLKNTEFILKELIC